MTDIDKLTSQVARHICGRPIQLIWGNPPSTTAVGQCYKSREDGRVIVYVGNLTGAKSRLDVMIHEALHGRYDYDILPYWEDRHQQRSAVKRTQAERETWRSSPRELRAKVTTTKLMDFAENTGGKYWLTHHSEIERLLRALLDWEF